MTPKEFYEKLKKLLFADRDAWQQEAERAQADVLLFHKKYEDAMETVAALKETISVLKKQNKFSTAPKVNLVDVSGSFVEESFLRIKDLVGPNGMLLFKYGRDGMARVPLDAKYRLPATRADLEKMIIRGYDEDKKYAEDYYDCENYAVYMKGLIDHEFLSNCIGVVVDWASRPGAHAYNLAMLADGTILVIEPQNAKIYSLTEKSAQYSLLAGVFLF